MACCFHDCLDLLPGCGAAADAVDGQQEHAVRCWYKCIEWGQPVPADRDHLGITDPQYHPGLASQQDVAIGQLPGGSDGSGYRVFQLTPAVARVPAAVHIAAKS